MRENRELAINLKLKKARAMLSEAEVLMQNKFYITVINRLTMVVFMPAKLYY